MYAIIECAGHQYQVSPKTSIEVDRLKLEQGAPFTSDKVLMVGGEGAETQVGTPYVAGYTVTGTVMEHFRDKKIIVFKMKRRKNYRRKQGHRQERTRILIDSIVAAGAEAPAKMATAESAPDTAAAAPVQAPAEAAPAKTPAEAAPAKAPAEKAAAEKADAGTAQAKPKAEAAAKKEPAKKAGAKKPAAKSSTDESED